MTKERLRALCMVIRNNRELANERERVSGGKNSLAGNNSASIE